MNNGSDFDGNEDVTYIPKRAFMEFCRHHKVYSHDEWSKFLDNLEVRIDFPKDPEESYEEFQWEAVKQVPSTQYVLGKRSVIFFGASFALVIVVLLAIAHFCLFYFVTFEEWEKEKKWLTNVKSGIEKLLPKREEEKPKSTSFELVQDVQKEKLKKPEDTTQKVGNPKLNNSKASQANTPPPEKKQKKEPSPFD